MRIILQETGIQPCCNDEQDVQHQRWQWRLQHLFPDLLLPQRDPEEQGHQVIEIFLEEDPYKRKIKKDADQQVEKDVF